MNPSDNPDLGLLWRMKQRRLANGVFYLVVGSPILITLFSLSERLALALCPPDAYLAVPAAEFLQMAAVIGAWVALLHLIKRGLLRLFPALVVRFDGLGPPLLPPRVTLGLALAVLLLAGAAYVAAAATEYCLGDTRILYRPAPLAGLQVYGWQDVRAVVTGCGRSRSGWAGYYVIVLNDDRRIAIPAGYNWRLANPHVVRALGGRADLFDSSRVAPDCGLDDAELLRHPLR